MDFVSSVRRNMTTGAYAQFTGRASRSEFWWFVVFTLLLGAVANTLDLLLPIDVLATLTSIATFVPNIALGIRRMHDIGKSGWWLLVGLIPIVGLILLIFWLGRKSDPGTNLWGTTEGA